MRLGSMRLGPPQPRRVADLINPAAALAPAANVIMQLAFPPATGTACWRAVPVGSSAAITAVRACCVVSCGGNPSLGAWFRRTYHHGYG